MDDAYIRGRSKPRPYDPNNDLLASHYRAKKHQRLKPYLSSDGYGTVETMP